MRVANADGASGSLRVAAIAVQEEPAVYLTVLPGKWLLAHCTPSWRTKDPHKGFQRIVKDDRARAIARTVLEDHRTFPNAITLAASERRFDRCEQGLVFPASAKFLVVDGQHRLWAQKHSEFDGKYPCIIHMDRNEQQMAELFLEINDNQRRVPSSLRWDLVRLVQSRDQGTALTADVVYELATRTESPFYAVGIDMTGESKSMTIKQGSLAPEIRKIVQRGRRLEDGTDLETWVSLFVRFFVAIRSVDPKWGTSESAFFKARVLRALLRVLGDLVDMEKSIAGLSTLELREYVEKIDALSLSTEEVRRIQGSAGVNDLYRQMRQQILP